MISFRILRQDNEDLRGHVKEPHAHPGKAPQPQVPGPHAHITTHKEGKARGKAAQGGGEPAGKGLQSVGTQVGKIEKAQPREGERDPGGEDLLGDRGKEEEQRQGQSAQPKGRSPPADPIPSQPVETQGVEELDRQEEPHPQEPVAKAPVQEQ